MSGLLDIDRVDVPRHVVEETLGHLRSAGRRGFEGITLWAGVKSGREFAVQVNIVPEQVGRRTEHGVSVSVGEDELHRINVWLFENGMRLIAQVHSHPGTAYHSDIDDEFAIAVKSGSLSVVVPDFGFRPFALGDCAVYRLLPGSGWTYVEPDFAERLIVIGSSHGQLPEGAAKAEENVGAVDTVPALGEEQLKWHWLTSLTKRLWPRRTS